MGIITDFDVFLIHSSYDKPIVRELAERLREDGLRVWLDEWEIKPGDNIPAKLEEGLENARILVLCMSTSAFASEWATLESQTFRFRDPLNKSRRFIPVRWDVESGRCERVFDGHTRALMSVAWSAENGANYDRQQSLSHLPATKSFSARFPGTDR